jgi:hypothetical protein
LFAGLLVIQLKIDSDSNPNIMQAAHELGGWQAIFSKAAQLLSDAIAKAQSK